MTLVLLITAGWLYVVFSGPRRRKARERKWNHRRAVALNHKIIAGHRFRGEK